MVSPCHVQNGRGKPGPYPVGTLFLSSSRLLTLSPQPGSHRASFKLSEPLNASLPGSLAASVALGSARLDFEATPVVDADHGESESRSRRRRGRCCGLWEQHMGNGVAPEGICAACRSGALSKVLPMGFEPMPLARFELESNSLDHSDAQKQNKMLSIE